MSWRSQGKLCCSLTTVTFQDLLSVRRYATGSGDQNRSATCACGATREVELIGNEQINKKQFMITNYKSYQGKEQGSVRDITGNLIQIGGGIRGDLLEEAAFKLNLKED